MKAIRLKEKGKEPMVFNTNDKLAAYCGVHSAVPSHVINVVNKYKSLCEKYNIESIDYTDECIVNPEYLSQGYKIIDVPGPIKYVANEDGIIINCANDRIIGQTTHYDGYIDVNLNGRIYRLHRIIATLFIPNPNNYPMVNHKNEIKSDNRACNLEWCTNSYNMSYGSLKTIWTKKGEKTPPKKIKATKDGEEFIFESISEASRFTGADAKSIRLCIKGLAKTGKGFSFFLLE